MFIGIVQKGRQLLGQKLHITTFYLFVKSQGGAKYWQCRRASKYYRGPTVQPTDADQKTDNRDKLCGEEQAQFYVFFYSGGFHFYSLFYNFIDFSNGPQVCSFSGVKLSLLAFIVSSPSVRAPSSKSLRAGFSIFISCHSPEEYRLSLRARIPRCNASEFKVPSRKSFRAGFLFISCHSPKEYRLSLRA